MEAKKDKARKESSREQKNKVDEDRRGGWKGERKENKRERRGKRKQGKTRRGGKKRELGETDGSVSLGSILGRWGVKECSKRHIKVGERKVRPGRRPAERVGRVAKDLSEESAWNAVPCGARCLCGQLGERIVSVDQDVLWSDGCRWNDEVGS
nr:hypothetical protein Iba_chr14aCG14150 [Ipomoea batatas]